MQQEKKYIPFEQIKITDRQWPDKTITKAPVWCSVDLRDGNQALVTPMGIPEKIRFFHTLVEVCQRYKGGIAFLPHQKQNTKFCVP